nr:unnamed protein product [Callosobruchus analis]
MKSVLNPKLLILADDQGRNLIHIFRNILPAKQFSVTTMLYPNAQIIDIVKNVGKLTTNFNKSDHIFVIGGSNDTLMKGFIQTELLKETFGNFKEHKRVSSDSAAVEMSKACFE